MLIITGPINQDKYQALVLLNVVFNVCVFFILVRYERIVTEFRIEFMTRRVRMIAEAVDNW